MSYSPPNFWELKSIVETLAFLHGAQLQQVTLQKNNFYLQLYQSEAWTLIVDLHQKSPALVLKKGRFKTKAKDKKPALLFLQSRFCNQRLSAIQLHEEYGRVVIIEFGSALMELHLVPNRVNLILRHDDRQVSWHKPKPLAKVDLPEPPQSLRTAAEIFTEYLDQFTGTSVTKDPSSKTNETQKKIKKLNRAIAKIDADLEKRAASKARQAAEWVRQHWSTEVPDSLKPEVDSSQSIHENLETLIVRAKKNEEKVAAQNQRRAQIQQEIEALRSGSSAVSEVPHQSLLRKAQSRGRTLYSASQKWVAYMGKSAEDNLNLLRRAKPWHIWMHIEEAASAHVLIQRGREQKLSVEDFERIARWLATQTPSVAKQDKVGVVVTECRYVRPIKGLKGKVQFSNERRWVIDLSQVP